MLYDNTTPWGARIQLRTLRCRRISGACQRTRSSSPSPSLPPPGHTASPTSALVGSGLEIAASPSCLYGANRLAHRRVVQPEMIRNLFQRIPMVLRMLLEEGAIEEHVVRNLLAWPHRGFGTHVSWEFPADATTPGVIARYMTRPRSPRSGCSGRRAVHRSSTGRKRSTHATRPISGCSLLWTSSFR